MKIFDYSAACLLHMLLLAELCMLSSSRPAHSLCGTYGSMNHQVNKWMTLAKKIHNLSESELKDFRGADIKLESLPVLTHTAEHLYSVQVNKTLSDLYVGAQSFRLHLDWLKTARENFSLPSQPAEGASTVLLHHCNIIEAALKQLGEEVPSAPAPSLPVVSTTFEALQFSVEISERLQGFGLWSKRVLRPLLTISRCPKH